MTARSVLIAATLVVACSPEPQAPPLGEAPDDTIERTIVRLGADGEPPDVRVDHISQETLEAMKQRRAALARGAPSSGDVQAVSRALEIDNGCSNNAIWLFDQPNLGGRMLCLIRSQSSLDAEDLGVFFRGFDKGTGTTLFWARAVRSFWAGVDQGYFRIGDQSPFESDDFFVVERRNFVSSTVANSNVLALHANDDFPRTTFTFSFGTPGSCPTNLSVRVTPDRGPSDTFLAIRQFDCSYALDAALGGTDVYRWGETHTVEVLQPRAPFCFVRPFDAGIAVGAASPSAFFADATLVDLDTCTAF